MKKLLISAAMIVYATNASANDLHLDCSYKNLLNGTNTVHIGIGSTVALDMGKLPNLSTDFSNEGNYYTFSITDLISVTDYAISKDLSNFTMTQQIVISDEEVSDPRTFTGSCEVKKF